MEGFGSWAKKFIFEEVENKASKLLSVKNDITGEVV